MSVPVTTTISNPDPALKFTTITALVSLLNTLISSNIPSTLTPYIIGSTTPGVDDQDKVWQRLDGAGRFLGTYVYYSGFWVLPTPPVGARFGIYFGDPTVYFDGTGKGLPGPGPVAWDYYGWAIANGNNCTANLSDRFIIGARMDNVGITGWNAGSGLWQTNVRGAPETFAGVADITLSAANTYAPAIGAVTAAHYTATGNARDPTGGIWGKDAGDGTGDPFNVVPPETGNPTPPAISTIPPFYAGAYITWIGYTSLG